MTSVNTIKTTSSEKSLNDFSKNVNSVNSFEENNFSKDLISENNSFLENPTFFDSNKMNNFYNYSDNNHYHSCDDNYRANNNSNVNNLMTSNNLNSETSNQSSINDETTQKPIRLISEEELLSMNENQQSIQLPDNVPDISIDFDALMSQYCEDINDSFVNPINENKTLTKEKVLTKSMKKNLKKKNKKKEKASLKEVNKETSSFTKNNLKENNNKIKMSSNSDLETLNIVQKEEKHFDKKMKFYFATSQFVTNKDKSDCLNRLEFDSDIEEDEERNSSFRWDNNYCRKTITYKHVNDLINDITLAENKDKKIYYQEFVIDNNPSFTKLFIDIDGKIKLFDGIYGESFSFHEEEEIKMLVDDLVDFLVIKFGDDTFKDNQSKIDFIKKNISYTHTTSINKYSYHIYFNSIIIQTCDFFMFKNIMKEFKSLEANLENEFVQAIDLQPYRKNTQLRFIYSCKNKDDTSFHVPYDEEIPDETNIYKYSIINYKEDEIKLKINGAMIYADIGDKPNITLASNITPYYIKYLFLPNTFKLLFAQQRPKNFTQLEYMEDFKLNQKIDLYYDFCNKCKRKHKHNFYLQFGIEVIRLTKYGNPNSCGMCKAIKYPKIIPERLLQMVIDRDLVRRINKSRYLFWNNNSWNLVEDEQQLKHNLLLMDHFRKEDIQEIYDFKGKYLENYLNIKLNSKFTKETQNPYYLKLNNGVYDLREDSFLPNSEHIKNIIKVYGIPIDFVSYEEMNEKEKKKYDKRYQYLINILDGIIPGVKDFPKGKDENVDAFRANLSSILYSGFKNVITIFVGLTLSGKSTIKKLVEALLQESYCEMEMTTYTQLKRSHLDPVKGRLSHKLASFASEIGELEKFQAVNFKQMTENLITARQLYSNDCNQLNHLSQFIDINVKPKFECIDTALEKRMCIIDFKSYFYRNGEANSVDIAGRRKMIKIDNKLESRIIQSELSLPFLKILIEWFRMYHLSKLNMYRRLTMLNKGITDNDKLYHELYEKLTCMFTVHNDDDKALEEVNEDKRCYYRCCLGADNKKFLCIKKSYLREYLLNQVDNSLKSGFAEFLNYKLNYSSSDYAIRVIKEDISKMKIHEIRYKIEMKEREESAIELMKVETSESSSDSESDIDKDDEEVIEVRTVYTKDEIEKKKKELESKEKQLKQIKHKQKFKDEISKKEEKENETDEDARREQIEKLKVRMKKKNERKKKERDSIVNRPKVTMHGTLKPSKMIPLNSAPCSCASSDSESDCKEKYKKKMKELKENRNLDRVGIRSETLDDENDNRKKINEDNNWIPDDNNWKSDEMMIDDYDC